MWLITIVHICKKSSFNKMSAVFSSKKNLCYPLLIFPKKLFLVVFFYFWENVRTKIIKFNRQMMKNYLQNALKGADFSCLRCNVLQLKCVIYFPLETMFHRKSVHLAIVWKPMTCSQFYVQTKWICYFFINGIELTMLRNSPLFALRPPITRGVNLKLPFTS